MAKGYEALFDRGGGRFKKLLAVSATALIASAMLAIPALALPTGPGVGEGKNISVFHNLDFVAAFGYTVGEPLTVQVFRDGVEIGSATGPAQDIDEGLPRNGALEVNHGPEGAPQPGDCWTGTTPDILPGDRVVVTSTEIINEGTPEETTEEVTDEVLVDNIIITKGPTDVRSTANKSDVILEGRASYADGTPIPIAQLNSGELRQGEPRFRATPNSVERIAGTKDGWRATYKAPYQVFQIKDPLTLAQQKRAILNGDHAMGYGHVAPLPPETQLVEGLGGGGPALGCEASPAASYAITNSNHKTVNVNSVGQDLVLSGVSQDASAVSVRLNDRDPATRPLTATATPSPDSGAQEWTVTFPSGVAPGERGVADLKDGMLAATGSYTIAGGTISGVNLKVLKDTIAPNTPRATPRPGVYQRSQSVILKSPGNKIYFTQNGRRPTTNSQLFRRQVRVTSTQRIKAIAVDKAGNRSAIGNFRYVIR
ncbi:hypothetical protein BH24ACT20_BH24ACT20_11490 [soil metagenome]